MTIERNSDTLTIKLSAKVNVEEIQRFLNFLRFKEIVSKSKASQEDADLIAREVNEGWWEKNKNYFLPEE
ncbi:MAG: hypothetical protein ACKO4W_15555 [Bacteroidota bacterium]